MKAVENDSMTGKTRMMSDLYRLDRLTGQKSKSCADSCKRKLDVKM